MPYLRFDTNQGQAALAQFRRTIENMEAELNTARSTTDRLVGSAWEAPAANEFRENMTTWQQYFSQALECLTRLNGRLEAEIQEWEETGSVFGTGAVTAAASGATAGATAAIAGMPAGVVTTIGAAGVGATNSSNPSVLSTVGFTTFMSPVYAQEPGVFVANPETGWQRFEPEYAQKELRDIFTEKAALEQEIASHPFSNFATQRQALFEKKQQLEAERNEWINKIQPDSPFMWGSDDKGLDVPWRTKSDALEDQIANIDRQLMELDQQEASEQAWLQERRQRLEAIGRQVEPYLHPAKDPTARQAIVDNLDKSMRQSIWYQPRTVQNPPIQIPASELNRDSYTALINQFMSCPQNPRYQRLPNGDTCCDVFVRDVLHATGVDVKEYGSINGIDASLRKANWPAVSAQEAQALANQGVPVVALMVGQGHDQHGAVIVPDSGSFNAEKGARIAQSGANIFMADDGKYVQDGFGTKRMGRVVYLRYPPG